MLTDNYAGSILWLSKQIKYKQLIKKQKKNINVDLDQ